MGDDADSSILIREGMCESAEKWSDRLRVGSTDIEFLLAEGVLRKIGGDSRDLRLDFVGLISTRESVVFALPKICSTQPNPDFVDIWRTVGSVQSYDKRRRRLLSGTAGDAAFISTGGKLLDLFLALLSWSSDNGLHQAEIQVFTSEFADIDWRRTVQRTFPAHQRTSVVYVEPHGRRTKQALTPIGEIQALALLDMTSRLGLLTEMWISLHDPLLEECRMVAEETDFLLSDLTEIREALGSAELHSTRDADRELVSILVRWAHADYHSASHPQVYGTTAYHTIWEDICVWFLGGDNQAGEHGTVASQPAYLVNGKTVALGPQIPDFLRLDGSDVWLADAKWYKAAAGELPGLSDFVKQLVYALSISAAVQVQLNCFLLPHIGGEVVRKMGTVEMMEAGGPDNRFPYITVLSVDWRAASDAYRFGRAQERWAHIFEA